MAANSSVIQNPSSLSSDELLDEYEKLSKKYSELKTYFDKSEQKIYNLNRNLQLSGAREACLQEELDAIAEAHSNELRTVDERHHIEADELRCRLTDAKELNGQLENEIERLKYEVVATTKVASKLNEAEAAMHRKRESQDNRQQYLESIEMENLSLARDGEEVKEKLVVAYNQIAEHEVRFGMGCLAII